MQMTQKEAREFIDRRVEEFIAKHTKCQEDEDLIFIDNVEKSNVSDYHGREILELLQNADDAYQKGIEDGKELDELNVTIKLSDNTLSVINNGTFFDKEGINSIIQSHNSSKRGNYIGNKGTGFRSVLNWASKIRIFSGVFNVEFSHQISEAVFNSIKNTDQIQKQLKKYPNLYVPMLAVPKYIPRDSEYGDDTTVIEITIDPNKNKDDFSVERQLEQIDFRILLFLPNTSKITIDINGNKTVYERIRSAIKSDAQFSNEISEVYLTKKIEDEIVVEEIFTLFERKIKGGVVEDKEEKDIYMSLAVPSDINNFACDHLYTFFPILNTQSPFCCVMHATYSLSASRDSLNSGDLNKDIIKHQLEQIVDVARYYINQNAYDVAMNILAPSNTNGSKLNFNQGFSKFGLEEIYLSMLQNLHFLPTVNGEGLSIEDQPKILEGTFPKSFKGEGFKALLKEFPNKRCACFVQILAKYFGIDLHISEKDLCECINTEAVNWGVKERVEVFDWWSKNYSDYLPMLLMKQDGMWLHRHESCYFLEGRFNEVALPEWVNIPTLNIDDQNQLFELIKNNDSFIKASTKYRLENNKDASTSRIICQNNIYPLIDFKYRDRNNIIPTINSCVDSYEKAVQFVNWLWNNFGSDKNWLPPKYNDIKYNFPGYKSHKVFSSCELYFGKEYGNELGQTIFDTIGDDNDKIPSMEIIGIPIQYKTDFCEFIAKFEVMTFPRIVSKKVTRIESAYLNLLNKRENISNYSKFKSCCLPYIDSLQNLLGELPTNVILEWLCVDENLRTHLKQNKTAYHVSYEFYGSKGGCYSRTIYSLPDYILYLFNNCKWVQLNDKRYSPCEIVYEKYGGQNKKFATITPYIDNSYVSAQLNSMVSHVDNAILLEVFDIFNFCTSILNLSSNNFYGILLKIPVLSISREVKMELSRTIYRMLEQAEPNLTFADSENKARFFNEGQLLVKHNKQFEYCYARDAVLPSVEMVFKNRQYIVDKSPRRGNMQTFTRVLNCREYSKDIKIESDTIVFSPCNEKFQKYFREFMFYAKAYSTSNKNLENVIENITVELVKDIGIISGGKSEFINEEYEMICKPSTKAYITIFNESFDILKLSELIEDVFSNIANTPGFDENRIGELFRAQTSFEREFLIRKEFGSLDVLNDGDVSKDIQQNFVRTVEKIDHSYKIEELGIDFKNFDSLENIARIIIVFKSLGIDTVRRFNEYGFEYSISFKKYYEYKTRQIISQNEDDYKNFLFTEALNDKMKQECFIEKVKAFNNYSFDGDSDAVLDIEQVLIEKFGDWHHRNEDDKDAEKEYRHNYIQMNPLDEFGDLIANDDSVKRMIYFSQREEFIQWLERQRKIGDEDKRNTQVEDLYAAVRDIVPQESEIEYTREHKPMTVPKPIGNGRAYVDSENERLNKRKKITGNKCELLIYNALVKEVGSKDRVKPVSEAFVSLGIISSGQADSTKGYDIKYYPVDSEGPCYVEVKKCDNGTFFITTRELEFAKEHADNYYIYVVYDVDKPTPRFSKLPARFWEDEHYKVTQVVEKYEVRF